MASPPHPSPAARPPILTTRRKIALGIAVAGVAAAVVLDLRPGLLIPDSEASRGIAQRFFGAALRPAFDYEASSVPEGTKPLLLKAVMAAVTTVKFAVAAVSLSLVAGLALGFVSSTAWRDRHEARRGWRRLFGRILFVIVRGFIAVTRSIHELIWAVIFLAAFGIVDIVAVVAIAIPYCGTFAKVFSEMIDETPRNASHTLAATGGRPAQVFLLGLVPQALPDLIGYTLYRLECGMRSAAVMGFLGIPTLGFFVMLSFENLHFREVWTYLYVLVILVVGFDLWGSAVRRRLVHGSDA